MEAVDMLATALLGIWGYESWQFGCNIRVGGRGVFLPYASVHQAPGLKILFSSS